MRCAEQSRLQRLHDALKRVTGQAWTVKIETSVASNGQAASAIAPPAAPAAVAVEKPELLRRIEEVLEAKTIQVDEGFGALAPPPADDVTDPDEE